jgi:hypothetical protein
MVTLRPRWPRRGRRRLLGRCSLHWCPRRHCRGHRRWPPSDRPSLPRSRRERAPAGPAAGVVGPLDVVVVVGAPAGTDAGP